MTETWIPIKGYESSYMVSNLGRVLSVPRAIRGVNGYYHHAGGLLCLVADKGKHAYGRLQVKLSKDGIARTRLVSHLVAEAFLGDRPNGMEVAHTDGDVKNNNVSNLSYKTPKQNTADKFIHGTVLRGEKIGNSKLKESDVLLIREMRKTEKIQDVADRFGVSIAQVSRICSGTRWGHI